MSRLVEQIKEALEAFAGITLQPALIGGLASAAHQVVRATRNVDFLADADDACRLHEILLVLGYRCVHRSEDAATSIESSSGAAARTIVRSVFDSWITPEPESPAKSVVNGFRAGYCAICIDRWCDQRRYTLNGLFSST